MRLRHPVQLAAAATAALLAAQLGGLSSIPSDAATGGSSPAQAAAKAAEAQAATPGAEAKGDYDSRTGSSAAEKQELQTRAAQDEAQPAVQSFAHSLGGQSIVDIDPLTGTPSQVMRLDGMLTSASTATPASIALGYVRAHADVFKLGDADIAALTLARDYVDVSGIHHLSFVQRAGGLPLFGNGLKANVAADGRLISLTGAPASSPAAPTGATSVSKDQAVSIAKSDVGDAATPSTGRDSVRQVAFLTSGGTRAAWETITMSAATPMLSVVDAQNGRVLYRDHLAADFAPTAQPTDPGDQLGLAYDNYPGAPLGGEQKRVNLTAHGWLPAGSTSLRGNNVGTYTDVDDDNAPSATEQVRPQASGDYLYRLVPFRLANLRCDDYVCDWNPNSANSWQRNRAQTSVNNFVLINRYHDYLRQAPIGFTEAAGNFQRINSTGNGKGGDAVIDQPLDGADTAAGLPDGNHIDNANFATPPDGMAPTMQMYLWHFPGTTFDEDPFIPSSGADDASIVLHEYTHGLSHRLVVDADNNPALDSQQGGSMGEAWSDYYALDYLANKGFLVDQPGKADVLEGEYVTGGAGIRFEATDCQVNAPAAQCPGGVATGPGGFTYGDFGKIAGAPEVHADGEIWAQTLWQLRSTLGPTLADSLITRGMELSPTFPSYLDMRNAIVLADQAIYSGTHTKQIWSVFASRGMGFFAGTLGGDDTKPVEDFSLPPSASAPQGSLAGTVTDSGTGEPVGGVTVAFGGHDSGIPGANWATTTNQDGTYSIDGATAGTYPDVYAIGAGYDRGVTTASIAGGSATVRDFDLVRDFAATSGGAVVGKTNGGEFAEDGCGPAADLNQSLGKGWSAFLPTTAAGKYFVVKLPVAVDLSSIEIDPNTTCGDGGSASTAKYKVETSTDGTTYKTAAQGTFVVADRGHLNKVALPSGAARAVRFIRFTAYTTQVAQIGGSCPGPYSGCEFIDSSELEAFGTPAS